MTAAWEGFLPLFFCHLLLLLAEGDHLVHACLAATAVQFQITEENETATSALKIDKRVGGPESRGVQHIGTTLALGDDEARLKCLFSLFLRAG